MNVTQTDINRLRSFLRGQLYPYEVDDALDIVFEDIARKGDEETPLFFAAKCAAIKVRKRRKRQTLSLELMLERPGQEHWLHEQDARTQRDHVMLHLEPEPIVLAHLCKCGRCGVGLQWHSHGHVRRTCDDCKRSSVQAGRVRHYDKQRATPEVAPEVRSEAHDQHQRDMARLRERLEGKT